VIWLAFVAGVVVGVVGIVIFAASAVKLWG
jgi:hypothetical protein